MSDLLPARKYLPNCSDMEWIPPSGIDTLVVLNLQARTEKCLEVWLCCLLGESRLLVYNYCLIGYQIRQSKPAVEVHRPLIE